MTFKGRSDFLFRFHYFSSVFKNMDLYKNSQSTYHKSI